MTLIAFVPNYGIPFWISDLLVSDKKQNSGQLPLTPAHNIDDYINYESDYRPGELFQKSYIIDGKVCILLAGRFNEIKVFLREFRQRSRYFQNLDAKCIVDFLNSFDVRKNFEKSSALISIVSEEKGLGLLSLGQWDTAEGNIASGSGAEEFLFQLQQPADIILNQPTGTLGYTIRTSLLLKARLLAAERVSLYNIKQYWGAGYETIIYNGSEFEKLDKVTYIITDSEFDENGDIGEPKPRLLTYYSYVDDVLFLYSFEFINFHGFDDGYYYGFYSNDFICDWFAVPPIDYSGPKITTPPFTGFESSYNAIGYGIKLNSGSFINPAITLECDDVKFTYLESGEVYLYIAKGAHEVIRTGAADVFRTL